MTPAPAGKRSEVQILTHLQRLEAESTHIIREAAAESERPVMLYSIGGVSAAPLNLYLPDLLIAHPHWAQFSLDALAGAEPQAEAK